MYLSNWSRRSPFLNRGVLVFVIAVGMVICFLFLMVYANIIGGSSTLETRLNWTTHSRELARSGYFHTVSSVVNGAAEVPLAPMSIPTLGEALGKFKPGVSVIGVAPEEGITRFFLLSQGIYGERDAEMGHLYGGFVTAIRYQDGQVRKFAGQSHGIDKAWFRYYLEDEAYKNWFQLPEVISNPGGAQSVRSALNRSRLYHDSLQADTAMFKSSAEVAASIFLLERISRMVATKYQYKDWFMNLASGSPAPAVSLDSSGGKKSITPELIDGLVPGQYKAQPSQKGMSDVLKAGGATLSDRFFSTFGQGESAKMLITEFYEVIHPMEDAIPIESERLYLRRVRGRPMFQGCKDVPIIGEVCKDVKSYVESTMGISYDDFLYQKINEMLGAQGLPVPGTPLPLGSLKAKMKENANASTTDTADASKIKSAMRSLMFFLRIFRPAMKMEAGSVRMAEYLLADGFLPVAALLMPEITTKDMLSDDMVPCEDLVKLIEEGGQINIRGEFEAEGAKITFKNCQ